MYFYILIQTIVNSIMEIVYYILSSILIITWALPFLPNQHWIFRVWDFGRIQLLVIQFLVIITGFILFYENKLLFWVFQLSLIICAIYNIILLVPYTPLFSIKTRSENLENIETISIISINVYQFNSEYDRLLNLIDEIDPDIILTMESNNAWENALSVIEKKYSQNLKIGLENTYGMHFYTRLKANSIMANYFTADDVPSIEATLMTKSGEKFTFFGVHPPPPSPSEEETSKQRDGELLSIAKKVVEKTNPVVVVGDFNSVAWAKSSILFRRTSKLIDSRVGRGFVSTFHAKYKLLRFPIDLFFHSPTIFTKTLKTLRPVGSDHLPLFSEFYINHTNNCQYEKVEQLEKEEKVKVDEMIDAGKNEEGNRPTIETK